MFLSRLNGEPIGFSVLGIFIIDKNTILTVITCMSVKVGLHCLNIQYLVHVCINNHHLAFLVV